jgi:hypothetical protein
MYSILLKIKYPTSLNNLNPYNHAKPTLPMSVLELKGEIHDMLAQVNHEENLYQIRWFIASLISKMNGEDPIYPEGLTKEQYEALMTSLAQSRDKAEVELSIGDWLDW